MMALTGAQSKLYFEQERHFISQETPFENDSHSPQAKSSILAGKRVLICEDEGITQMQLRRILQNAGLHVVGTARNGQLGVEMALQEKPDLILMDIQMPVMNGLEATREILKSFHTCVAMLTAFSNEETRQVAQALGSCGYIMKPVTAETLIPLLESAYEQFTLT